MKLSRLEIKQREKFFFHAFKLGYQVGRDKKWTKKPMCDVVLKALWARYMDTVKLSYLDVPELKRGAYIAPEDVTEI